MIEKVKEGFLKFIYELEKSNEKEEGKEIVDFDTWVKNFYDEVNDSSNKKNKKDKNKSWSKLDKTVKTIQKNKENFNTLNTKENQSQNLQRQIKEKYQRKYSNPIDRNSIGDKNSTIYKKKKKRLKKSELKKAVIYSEIIANAKSKR